MADLTSPDNIAKWTAADSASLIQESQTQGDSIQAALAKRQRYDYAWADSAARIAQTGMVTGSRGYQIDTKAEYIYENSTWRLNRAHIEFTSSKSIASGGQSLIGTMTVQSSRTTSTTFCTSPGDGQIVIVDPGIYSISAFTILVGGGTLNLCFLQVSSTSPTFDTGRITRGGLTPGDDTMTLGMPNLYVATANTTYYLTCYQSTGGNRTIDTILRVTRMG